jgi:hypothetical protein
MSTAVDTKKYIRIVGDIRPPAADSGVGSPVHVVFTSFDRTLKALQKAMQLAGTSNSEVDVLAVQVVPFVLPLDEPPAPFEFLVRRFAEVADRFSGQIKIKPYLCRDLLEALKRIIDHKCTVVMGVRKRWWPTREERVARQLQRAGFNVVIVETE